MPTGSQENAEGLALRVVELTRTELLRRRMTIRELAEATDVSTNYLATRLRGERILNLRDFEMIARAFGWEPQEFLARVYYTFASDYPGRLVPRYGVMVSDRDGMVIYRSQDAEPPVGSPLGESERAAATVGGASDDDDLPIASTKEVRERLKKSDVAPAAKRGRKITEQ